jgi:hypothetical protein
VLLKSTRAALVVALVIAASASHSLAQSRAKECIRASEQGQEKRKDGALVEAKQLFAACAAESCAPVIRSDCAQWFREVDATLPTVVFAARSQDGSDIANVRVELDGRVVSEELDGRPIEIDPGNRVFRFVRGADTIERRVVINAGQKNREILAQFPGGEGASSGGSGTDASPGDRSVPPKSSAPSSPLPWILGGAGVVAIGVGAYIGIAARSDLKNLESSPCADTRTCEQSEVDSVKRRFLIADIAMGAGVVALGAGVVILLSRDDAPKSARRPTRVVLTPGMAHLTGSF